MMATQKSSKRKTAVAKPHKEIKVTPEKARAETEIALAKVQAEERARLKTEEALIATPETLTVAEAKIEPERQVKTKSEPALTKVPEDLTAPQTSIDLEYQHKAEQARVVAKSALTEVKKASEVEVEKTGLPLSAPEGGGAEQRVSFVVRLTVDERGQPRRTEIEHAQSGKKEIFPALDGQRLVTFMQAYLGPQVISEPLITPEPLPPIAEAAQPELPKPSANLTFSEVRIFRTGTSGDMALMLNAAEAFEVQARFQIQGPDALSLTTRESSYEMRVYAHELTGGSSTLLTRYQANLVRDVLEYTPQTPIPGLAPGLYRLLTLVTLSTPTKVVGYYEGPVFQVGEVEPPVHHAASQPASMTR
jgi:hypothetical protein